MSLKLEDGNEQRDIASIKCEWKNNLEILAAKEAMEVQKSLTHHIFSSNESQAWFQVCISN